MTIVSSEVSEGDARNCRDVLSDYINDSRTGLSESIKYVWGDLSPNYGDSIGTTEIFRRLGGRELCALWRELWASYGREGEAS